MTSNIGSFIRLAEIEEGLSSIDAEARFEAGWVYLNSTISREVDTKGEFKDRVTYCLGRPVVDK
jgi:hypothetical protein